MKRARARASVEALQRHACLANLYDTWIYFLNALRHAHARRNSSSAPSIQMFTLSRSRQWQARRGTVARSRSGGLSRLATFTTANVGLYSPRCRASGVVFNIYKAAAVRRADTLHAWTPARRRMRASPCARGPGIWRRKGTLYLQLT